jgi:hypothetical protein
MIWYKNYALSHLKLGYPMDSTSQSGAKAGSLEEKSLATAKTQKEYL